jgi:hypothetical protein
LSKLPFVNVKINYNITKTIISASQNDSFKFSILALSDIHLDSHKSNHDLFTNYCNQALETESGIIINGDFYDAMSGPGDKRGAQSTLRDPIARSAYFDDLIELGTKILHPYRLNLLMLGQGNHESSVLKHYGTDLTERTVGILCGRGSSVTNGRYSGWLDWFFKVDKCQTAAKLYGFYHHGSGYSSKSKVVEACSEMPDADVFFYGHTHKFWHERLNRKRRTTNSVFDDSQLILGIPGMKDDTIDEGKVSKKDIYGSRAEGWATEKGIRSKPLGAWWIDFTWSRYFRRFVLSAREALPV